MMGASCAGIDAEKSAILYAIGALVEASESNKETRQKLYEYASVLIENLKREV